MSECKEIVSIVDDCIEDKWAVKYEHTTLIREEIQSLPAREVSTLLSDLLDHLGLVAIKTVASGYPNSVDYVNGRTDAKPVSSDYINYTKFSFQHKDQS